MADRKLSRIHTLLQGNVGLHQPVTVVPRGIAIPVDPTLKGEARFAYRIGGDSQILVPHNTMFLTVGAQQGDTVISVEALLPSMPLGSIISFRGRERHFLADTAEDPNRLTVVAATGLLAAHDVREPVYLHAVPLVVEFEASEGDLVLEVSSTVFRVLLGDKVEILADRNVPGSAVTYTVEAFTASDEDELPYTYTLQFTEALGRDVAEGEVVYLRALPGYRSEVIPLPTQQSIWGENTGPFLWDIFENRLHDGVDPVDTTLAIETISSAYDPLDALAVIQKNTPHWRVPLETSSFLFWEKLRGSFTFRSTTRKYTVAVPDEDGDFLITQRLRPVARDVGWRATFEALGGDATLRVGFHLAKEPDSAPVVPSGYSYDATTRTYYRETTISPGAVRVVNIESPSGLDFDRLIVAAHMPTDGTTLTLRDWSQPEGRSSWVRYTVVADVNGDYTWASSGLIIKPIFYTADSMRRIQRLNSGAAMI